MASGIMPSAGGKHRTDAMLVDKLPEEINEMKIRDDKAEKEMEAAVVDGNGTGKGHIIVTTIGGKNGEPKQLNPSASAYKMSNDEWRVVHDNLERRKYLMMEYLAKHAGLDMAALDRQLPLLESSKRLLGMRQTVEVPPGEDENTDSDVVEEDNGSDEGEWTEEEDGEDEEEEEEEDSDDADDET